MPALVYLDQNAAIGLWEWKAQNWPHALLHSDFRHCSEVVEQDCGLPFEEGGYYGQLGGGAFPVRDIPLEHHPS